MVESLSSSSSSVLRFLLTENDPYTRLKPGDQGEVVMVDDIGTVHVAWDNGSSLGVAYGEDQIKRL